MVNKNVFFQVLSAALYGYGYSRPWQDEYEPPRLGCGRKDFEATLAEFEFLSDPDPGTDFSILVYYTSELNHAIKKGLYCIVTIPISFTFFSQKVVGSNPALGVRWNKKEQKNTWEDAQYLFDIN